MFIFAGIALLFWFMMRYTVFGRSMYAIGANPAAARLAGIRVQAGRSSSASSSAACAWRIGRTDPRLAARERHRRQAADRAGAVRVTAVVLGGACLAGGRGTIVGTMLGLLIIGTLNNGLVLLNVPASGRRSPSGALLIFAVSFDQLRIRLTSN